MVIMAHYAFLDKDNVVTEVITGRNENEVVDGISDWESYYGEIRGQICKRTSRSGSIRKHFAGIGYTYREDLDAFISPSPFPSWVLNEDDCIWEPPVSYPTDGKDYRWNEATLSWDEVKK